MSQHIVAASIFPTRNQADEVASVWRNNAVRPDTGPRNVRVFKRTVKAGGALIEAWAVVVYKREGIKKPL